MITYAAINLTNKKFYVGSTVDFERRVKGHHASREDYPFQNSLRKDPENFYWIVGDDDGLTDRSEEQYYLDFYHGTEWCYNLNPKASVPPSALGKGGPNHHLHGKIWDPEVIARRTAHCSGETNPSYGKKWWKDGLGSYSLEFECPGEGWVSGARGPEEGKFAGENNPMFGKSGELSPSWGMKWFNNGTELRKTFENPGEGWVEGRGNWYNNGIEENFFLLPPSGNWVEGRIKKGTQKNPYQGQRTWSLGSNNPKSRPVFLIHKDWDNEKFYETISQAAFENNLNGSHLSAVAKGKRKHCKGFTARYA